MLSVYQNGTWTATQGFNFCLTTVLPPFKAPIYKISLSTEASVLFQCNITSLHPNNNIQFCLFQ